MIMLERWNKIKMNQVETETPGGSVATTTEGTSSATTSNKPVVTPPIENKVPPQVENKAVPPIEDSAELSALAELKNKTKEDVVPLVENKVIPPVVEEYELEFSEKSPLTEKEMDNIAALAEKYNWTKEEAQAHIEEREQLYSRGFEALKTQAMDIVRAEKEKLFADPDFKGEKLKDSLATIDLVVEKYGSPELAKYLQGPGGNSLPLSKMLLKIGQLMSPEDKIGGKGTATTNSDPNSLEAAYRRQYPQFFE